MNTEVHENIKANRIKSGMTQKQLAEKIGVAEITIRQYESGKRIPKSNILIRLADTFKISIYDLLGEKAPADYNKGQVTISIGKEKMLVDPIELQKTVNRVVNKVHPTKLSSLLDSFDILNDKGQNKAIEQVEMLTKIEEYTTPDDEPAQK